MSTFDTIYARVILAGQMGLLLVTLVGRTISTVQLTVARCMMAPTYTTVAWSDLGLHYACFRYCHRSSSFCFVCRCYLYYLFKHCRFFFCCKRFTYIYWPYLYINHRMTMYVNTDLIYFDIIIKPITIR